MECKTPIELLQSANEEIKSLRRRCELQHARLSVYDEMMAMFHTHPNLKTGGAMHPDIVHEIDDYLNCVDSHNTSAKAK